MTGQKMTSITIIPMEIGKSLQTGKKHALKKFDQFILNTSCFWGSSGSDVTSDESVVQFHEIFVTKMNLFLLLKL